MHTWTRSFGQKHGLGQSLGLFLCSLLTEVRHNSSYATEQWTSYVPLMWAVLRCDGLQVCDGIIFPSRLPGFRACWTCWLACAYLRHQLCCPSWRATSWGSGHYCPCFLHFDKSLEPRWQARLGSWRGSKSLQNQFLSIKYQWEKLFVVNRSVVFNLNIRWSQWVQLSPTFVFGRRAPLCLSLSLYIHMYYRRKFRSQTSDTMGRWKAEKKVRRESQRREETRREEQAEM